MGKTVKRSLKGPVLQNESGVTMLEMVAALSLTALLLGILSQLLFSGVRLWSRQDRFYQQQHRFKFVYQTLYNDFSTAFASTYLPEPAMKGDDVEVQFWSETEKGLVQIKYCYDHTEQTVSRTEGFWGQEVAAKPLFKEVQQWKLEYFEPEWKSWVADWDHGDKGKLPSLIRVSIATKSGDLGTMTFPVKAWRKEVE